MALWTVLCLGVIGVSQVRAEALLPILENGDWNQFGKEDPVVADSNTIPVSQDATYPAYMAQWRGVTAIGGFPIGKYTFTSETEYTVEYPKSVATTDTPQVIELRSAILGRPLAVFNLSYNFGGVIPAPEPKDVNGTWVSYRDEPVNARLKTTITVSNGEEVDRMVENATRDDQDGETVTGDADNYTKVIIGLNPRLKMKLTRFPRLQPSRRG